MKLHQSGFMKSAGVALILGLAPVSYGAEPQQCAALFARLGSGSGLTLTQRAAFPVGMALGAANDIAVTCLACAGGVIPPELGRWLPLANEIANVSATSTGKTWIYSGLSKRLADGVALGAILGHSVSAGVNHGGLAGGLTLAANLGLTYWFPNKYFHSVMHGASSWVPSRMPRLKAVAESGVGQGVVGVSLILVIEQILARAEEISSHVGDRHAGSVETCESPSESGPSVPEEGRIKKALAGFFIDQELGLSEMNDPLLTEIQSYLFGAAPGQQLFSLQIGEPPRLQQKPIFHWVDRRVIEGRCRELLSEPELNAFFKRLSLISGD